MKRKERDLGFGVLEGEKERGGRDGSGNPSPQYPFPSPLSFSSLGQSHMGGAPTPRGWCVSPLGP